MSYFEEELAKAEKIIENSKVVIAQMAATIAAYEKAMSEHIDTIDSHEKTISGLSGYATSGETALATFHEKITEFDVFVKQTASVANMIDEPVNAQAAEPEKTTIKF